MNRLANEQFWGLLFLNQSDQRKSSHLLQGWRQAYANKQRDLYPDDLPGMFEVMKTVQIKKKPKNRSQDSDKNKNNGDLNDNNVQPGAESYAQDGKEIRCFCCGKEGKLSSNYQLKDKIPSKEWYNKTGVEHWKTKK